MNSKQKRNLKRLLKHKGFTPAEIESEILKHTTGSTSEAPNELTPRQVKRNAQRRRKTSKAK